MEKRVEMILGDVVTGGAKTIEFDLTTYGITTAFVEHILQDCKSIDISNFVSDGTNGVGIFKDRGSNKILTNGHYEAENYADYWDSIRADSGVNHSGYYVVAHIVLNF